MKENITSFVLSIKTELFALAFVGVSIVTATHIVQFLNAVVALASVVRTYKKNNKK